MTASISTREGLIDALQEAAELEHGLMLQYLFAALSLKQRADERITPDQQEKIRGWKGVILGIAREEMTHLAIVCNLLSAVGGAPRFGRPNFPQVAKDYYPFAFALTPLSDATLCRFIRFELPKGEPVPEPVVRPRATAGIGPLLMDQNFAPVIPDPVEYEYVGGLYREIAAAFSSMPEKTLFIGPKPAQEFESFTRRMQVLTVRDRKSALAAVALIVNQGEGSPKSRQDSHYGRFLQIRKEYLEALAAEPTFAPGRSVVSNPRTRPHRDAPAGGVVLTNRAAIEAVEFFNGLYEVVLLLLCQLYSYGGETLGERTAIRDAARELMTLGIRPTAELLTEIPAQDPADGTLAGPSFELYSPFQLSTQRANRWTLLDERLGVLVDAAKDFGARQSRFTLMAENVALIAANLRTVRAAEAALTVPEAN